ncbi:MAG: hypothetical protein Fur005_12300 [Roseiflexaceae bacterium]
MTALVIPRSLRDLGISTGLPEIPRSAQHDGWEVSPCVLHDEGVAQKDKRAPFFAEKKGAQWQRRRIT